MATLTISFTEPATAPDDGYLVKYKKTSDSVYTTVTPNPSESPVVITGLDNADYEGTIQSECSGNISDVVAFSAAAVPVPVTVNYSLTKDDNPHVEILIVPVLNGTNLGNIYPTSTGTFAGTMSGDSLYIGLNHSVTGAPWPAGASASIVITEDGVTVYDSGSVTNSSIDVLGSYTLTLAAGKVYQVTAVSNSASTAYTPVTFSMSNLSSAPLSVGTEVVSFEFVDHTDELFILHTGQYTQPQNNVGMNWFTDAATGKLTVTNNSAFSLDFVLSNTAEGGSYTSATTTVLAGATAVFDSLVKTGYSISYTDTP